MRIYNSFAEITFDKKRLISVGSFDGVHRGHEFILKSMIAQAKNENLKTLVITFDPHPQCVLGKHPDFKILSDKNEKLQLFARFQIDEVLVIPFTIEFSMIDARSFLLDYLVGKIGFTQILAGYDNFFGKDRTGNRTLLEQEAERHGYKVTETGIFRSKDFVISSTLIRKLLQDNNIETANELLGYSYSLNGEVVTGNRLGRTLGFPTINIKPNNCKKLLPGCGVYLTRSYLNGDEFFGMANIGLRPTLTNDKNPTLEINLFDFSGDAYGMPVKSEFLHFIRPEQKFSEVDDLIAQMQSDKKKCSELINKLL